MAPTVEGCRARAREGVACPPDVVPLAKPGGGTRWLTILDPADATRYASLVRPWVPALTDVQGGHVFGTGTKASTLSIDRAAWRRAVAAAIHARRDPAVVLADVRDCFPSIGGRALGSGSRHAGIPSEVARSIVSFVATISAAGTPGLPVGPRPSMLLGSAVLTIADEEVRRAGATVVRWVDDVMIVADGPRGAARAFDAWVRALRPLGLEPHEGKYHRARGMDASLGALESTAAVSISVPRLPSVEGSPVP